MFALGLPFKTGNFCLALLDNSHHRRRATILRSPSYEKPRPHGEALADDTSRKDRGSKEMVNWCMKRPTRKWVLQPQLHPWIKVSSPALSESLTYKTESKIEWFFETTKFWGQFVMQQQITRTTSINSSAPVMVFQYVLSDEKTLHSVWGVDSALWVRVGLEVVPCWHSLCRRPREGMAGSYGLEIG